MVLITAFQEKLETVGPKNAKLVLIDNLDNKSYHGFCNFRVEQTKEMIINTLKSTGLTLYDSKNYKRYYHAYSINLKEGIEIYCPKCHTFNKNSRTITADSINLFGASCEHCQTYHPEVKGLGFKTHVYVDTHLKISANQEKKQVRVSRSYYQRKAVANNKTNYRGFDSITTMQTFVIDFAQKQIYKLPFMTIHEEKRKQTKESGGITSALYNGLLHMMSRQDEHAVFDACESFFGVDSIDRRRLDIEYFPHCMLSLVLFEKLDHNTVQKTHLWTAANSMTHTYKQKMRKILLKENNFTQCIHTAALTFGGTACDADYFIDLFENKKNNIDVTANHFIIYLYFTSRTKMPSRAMNLIKLSIENESFLLSNYAAIGFGKAEIIGYKNILTYYKKPEMMLSDLESALLKKILGEDKHVNRWKRQYIDNYFYICDQFDYLKRNCGITNTKRRFKSYQEMRNFVNDIDTKNTKKGVAA